MKKIAILFVFTLLMGYSSFSQGKFQFMNGDATVKLPDTLVINVVKEMDNNGIVKTLIGFKNISEVTVEGIRMKGNKTGTWNDDQHDVSYCHIQCVDINQITPLPGITLEPGGVFDNTKVHKDSTFYISFAYQGPYLGNFYFKMEATSKEGDKEELVINYHVKDLDAISKVVEKQSTEVSVYPNPASNVIKIKYDNQGSYNNQLIIRNMVGAVVKTIPLKENLMEVSIADLANGMYFYSLSVDGVIQNTKKLIIKR